MALVSVTAWVKTSLWPAVVRKPGLSLCLACSTHQSDSVLEPVAGALVVSGQRGWLASAGWTVPVPSSVFLEWTLFFAHREYELQRSSLFAHPHSCLFPGTSPASCGPPRAPSSQPRHFHC